MVVAAERSVDGAPIRPFSVEVPPADLDDLRTRIEATRWPEEETVDDQSQGVRLATIQALARHWATDYDWRRCEARLNDLTLYGLTNTAVSGHSGSPSVQPIRPRDPAYPTGLA